jgi:hypothetical protein
MLQIDAIYGNQEPAKSLILPIRALEPRRSSKLIPKFGTACKGWTTPIEVDSQPGGKLGSTPLTPVRSPRSDHPGPITAAAQPRPSGLKPGFRLDRSSILSLPPLIRSDGAC